MKKKPRNPNVRCVAYPLKEFWRMRYGAERREAIMDYLLVNRKIMVNRKYCPQMDEDNDLKYMLKKGIIKQIRYTGKFNKIWKFPGSNRSYVVLT